jgi:hypothetical protein
VGGDGSAACGLALGLAGAVADHPAGRVSRDACAACCRFNQPSPERLNPVVASALSRLLETAVVEGLPGCDPDRAAALLKWTRRHLLVFPLGRAPMRPARADRRCTYLGAPLSPNGASTAAPGGELSEPARVCRHPAHEVTTRDGCHRCRDWSDRPRPAPEPLRTLVPPPGPRRGPRVRRWAVGVTTAPRGLPTLDWTVDSLVRAGWDRVFLFEDLPVGMASRTARMPGTARRTRVGAWPNYLLGLAELIMHEPRADAYLMAQDDVLFYDRSDLRDYLERTLWFGAPPGLVSLYCGSAYTRSAAGWYRNDRRWTWGALAFVFPRALARRFVADPRVLAHRWTGRHDGRANVDVVIGEWARRNRIPVHFPTPSLAQHIGDASTLWETEPALGLRRADRFLGDSAPDPTNPSP